jgi:hypothetical protein
MLNLVVATNGWQTQGMGAEHVLTEAAERAAARAEKDDIVTRPLGGGRWAATSSDRASEYVVAWDEVRHGLTCTCMTQGPVCKHRVAVIWQQRLILWEV